MSKSIDIANYYPAIQIAADMIAPYAVKTPVLCNEQLNALTSARLYFKCENLQRTGAFKFRGACHALLQLTSDQRQAGVYTVSSGNHGAALACAGRLLDIAVTVAVPRTAPKVKQENIARYQANIIMIEPGMEAREAFVAQQQADNGEQTFIPPYDHPHIIQGQGTAALELVQQHPELTRLLTPLGGGGLLSGSTVVARQHGIDAVYGAEPANADDAHESLAKGHIQPARKPVSICDGLLTSLGKHTFGILSEHLDQVLLVEDTDTRKAQQLIWQHLKVIVEPSAAITLAAVINHPELFKHQDVGIILSGGNVALAGEQFA
ncbi:threonine dehydratase [Pseudidiomarina planktonica]|uniref:Threonine dehydratase n=1 Tax=Pseudidiomarina planktonica TaxID=1323738 RepID=A0A1Y6EE89_9GAMM|nr:pyridoxal-phosphate dependent enzyme [Pseudidiomarina planktonica]RUO66236.1 serine/threonine dehydratase [Pseudidiomarina planktonica]SMQ59491.1 threonine dehydratase [Pseudidiomarina planktonica]